VVGVAALRVAAAGVASPVAPQAAEAAAARREAAEAAEAAAQRAVRPAAWGPGALNWSTILLGWVWRHFATRELPVSDQRIVNIADPKALPGKRTRVCEGLVPMGEWRIVL
jgi:hypothetical protein